MCKSITTHLQKQAKTISDPMVRDWLRGVLRGDHAREKTTSAEKTGSKSGTAKVIRA